MLIFVDIETVKDTENLKNFNLKKLEEKYWEKILFYPEINKIVTITLWRIENWNNIIKNLEWDEKEQIKSFFKAIKWNNICWFNIKGFDLPFIIKRSLFHKLQIPNELKFFWKKPWELDHIIDLQEIYRCLVFSSLWNLDLICNFLWITSPKDDNIDWWQVQRYFDESKIKEILEYCKKDVEATILIYNYFKEYNLI